MSKIILDKENYIYMDCNIEMSQKAMSNLLYAVIMTHSTISSTFGIGIYEYTRKQNSYNTVNIKVHIHPTKINEFEELSEVKLKSPIKLNIYNDNTTEN